MTQTNAKVPIDDTDERATRRRKTPVLVAGAVIGVGLGGVIDGIVFQQLLQWHHTLTNLVGSGPPSAIAANLRADGLVSILSLMVALAGLGMLWAAVARPGVVLSTRSFIASGLAGWCGFNVIEGVLAHHVLGLHQMHYGSQGPAFDYAYLLLSAALGVLFTAIARSERPRMRGARPWWQPGRATAPDLRAASAQEPALITPPPRV